MAEGITVTEADDGQRLDRWLKKHYPDVPFGQVQKILRTGQLRVDGNPGSDGPMWLKPEGQPGHYRVSARVDHGTNAVFDDGDGNGKLWISQATLLRRT